MIAWGGNDTTTGGAGAGGPAVYRSLDDSGLREAARAAILPGRDVSDAVLRLCAALVRWLAYAPLWALPLALVAALAGAVLTVTVAVLAAAAARLLAIIALSLPAGTPAGAAPDGATDGADAGGES